MPDTRSPDLLSQLTCGNEETLCLLRDFGLAATVQENIGPLHVTIQSGSCLELTCRGMQITLGADGLFQSWYQSLPHQHPLVKIAKKVFSSQAALVLHDATCGLGRDSLLLALYAQRYFPSIKIISYEQNPLSAAVAAWQSQCIQTWSVIHAPFQTCSHASHVLIDPMFPPHPKTALPQKYSQMLQQITAGDLMSDGPDLLQHARQIGARWWCIKQPPWEKKTLWQVHTTLS